MSEPRAMADTYPELAVNRSFLSAFLAEAPPCLALCIVEEGAARWARAALR